MTQSHKFHDTQLEAIAEIARRYNMQMRTATPASTGIGAPGNGAGTAAPADLSRSGMSATPSGAASAVPFPRASTLAVMQDKFLNAMVAGQSVPVTLQTNAFLAAIVLDVQIVAVNVTTAVLFNNDGPFNIFGASGIALSDDLEMYERCQAGYAAEAVEWIDFGRGYGIDRVDANGTVNGTGTSELPMRNQFKAWSAYMAVE